MSRAVWLNFYAQGWEVSHYADICLTNCQKIHLSIHQQAAKSGRLLTKCNRMHLPPSSTVQQMNQVPFLGWMFLHLLIRGWWSQQKKTFLVASILSASFSPFGRSIPDSISDNLGQPLTSPSDGNWENTRHSITPQQQAIV